VMISASHNPMEDNGIKFFGPAGFKLSDEQEAEIERFLENEDYLPRPTGADVGIVNDYFEVGQKYLSFFKESIDNDFAGMKIAFDYAHGAKPSLPTHLFADLEADIAPIGSSPTVWNITDK